MFEGSLGAKTAPIVQAFFKYISLLSSTRFNPYKKIFSKALSAGLKNNIANNLIEHELPITFLYAFLIRGTLEILPILADGFFAKEPNGLEFLISDAGLGALFSGAIKSVFNKSKSG